MSSKLGLISFESHYYHLLSLCGQCSRESDSVHWHVKHCTNGAWPQVLDSSISLLRYSRGEHPEAVQYIIDHACWYRLFLPSSWLDNYGCCGGHISKKWRFVTSACHKIARSTDEATSNSKQKRLYTWGLQIAWCKILRYQKYWRVWLIRPAQSPFTTFLLKKNETCANIYQSQTWTLQAEHCLDLEVSENWCTIIWGTCQLLLRPRRQIWVLNSLSGFGVEHVYKSFSICCLQLETKQVECSLTVQQTKKSSAFHFDSFRPRCRVCECTL